MAEQRILSGLCEYCAGTGIYEPVERFSLSDPRLVPGRSENCAFCRPNPSGNIGQIKAARASQHRNMAEKRIAAVQPGLGARMSDVESWNAEAGR